MVSIAEFVGKQPLPQFNMPSPSELAEQDIWANYDKDSDSLLIYFTGKPVPAVGYYLDDNVLVFASEETNEVVGIEFENFETEFLAQYSDVSTVVWPGMKATLHAGWSESLRSLAVIVMYLFSSPLNEKGKQLPLGLAPA